MSNNLSASLIPVLPELFMAVMGMFILVLGVFRGEGGYKLVSRYAILAMIAATLVICKFSKGTLTAFHGMFIEDSFAALMKTVVLLGGATALFMASGYLKRENLERNELPVLMMFSVLGMMMMISANNLISLYMGLELQSLPLYVLAAIQRDNLRSSEAGVKYFVLGALSSGMLLYGASMIYGFTGTTDFSQIAAVFNESTTQNVGAIVGMIFLMTGLAFKISAVPFHMWTPDVYEGAPTPIAAFFAIAPKVAAIALMTRVFMGPFGGMISDWQQVISLLSIASMSLGALAAIAQTNIKRLLAYSSIGHMGYALVGLAAGSVAGVKAVILYMVIYVFMSAGTFAVVLCMKRKGNMVENISDLSGLSKNQPMLALALTILMFSMSGIPPLAGFFGKFFIFQAAVNAHLYTLSIIGVLTSVIAAYYYLRIIKVMYFDDPAEDPLDKGVETNLGAVLYVSVLFVLFFVVYPGPLMERAQDAALSLLS